MTDLATELDRARALDVDELADAIETIGFECTRCGACCKAAEGDAVSTDGDGAANEGDGESTEEDAEPTGDGAGGREDHTATVFPDEVRALQATAPGEAEYDWRDVARPMPYGLDEADTGETFEWALQTDACGDCTFYADEGETPEDEAGRCTVYGDRPLVCRTYPFSVTLEGTSQPMGAAVEREGPVRAHECEGLGREISRADAEELARTLKERAVRELEEAIAVTDAYAPANPGPDETVVHDSEGAKRPDGTPLEE